MAEISTIAPPLTGHSGDVGNSDPSAQITQIPGMQAALDTNTGNPVGQVKSLDGSVTVVRADGTQESLNNGDKVYQGDKIETGADGKVGIVFLDGSTFSISTNGIFTIDELIFNPTLGTGSSVLYVTIGIFTYASGEIAKSGDESSTITTPVATIRIRGTTIIGKIGPEGSDNVITLLRDEDGHLGEIAIITSAGERLVSAPMESYSLTSRDSSLEDTRVIDQNEFNRIFGNDVQIIPSQPAQDSAQTDPSASNPGQDTAFSVGDVDQVALDGSSPASDLGQTTTKPGENDGPPLAPSGEPINEIPIAAAAPTNKAPQTEAIAVTGDAGDNVSGNEDTSIVLSFNNPLPDTTGTITVNIVDVPAGAIISPAIDEGGGVWSVNPADLASLTLTPPADFSGTIKLCI